MKSAPSSILFPLRGEWRAGNSPADRVPSHGTDHFGQRYAIDFFQLDSATDLPFNGSVVPYFLRRAPIEQFLCWDAAVHSPVTGRVVVAADGAADGQSINFFTSMIKAWVGPIGSVRRDPRRLAGNHLILESDVGFLLFAHLRRDSLAVNAGEVVTEGSLLGHVGNSGNSTMPHLHMQRMDGPDPFRAKGLPLVFHGLERLDDGHWTSVPNWVPGRRDRFRSVES